MISEKLTSLDIWLIRRCIMPISHEIDRRWHVNPWDQAAKILMFSAVLAVMDLLLNVAKGWGMTALAVLLILAILLVRGFDIIRLSRISEAYEKNPAVIPVDWLYYVIPHNRMMHLFMGFGLFAPFDLASSLAAYSGILSVCIHFIPRLWFGVAGIGFYFAACPRPPAKRKEKKVHAPIGAELAVR